VRFTSSDRRAILPSNYTFTAGDGGTHTFTVTLRSKKSQSITVGDTANGSITGTASVDVR
jgi:adhesin/invasin